MRQQMREEMLRQMRGHMHILIRRFFLSEKLVVDLTTNLPAKISCASAAELAPAFSVAFAVSKPFS